MRRRALIYVQPGHVSPHKQVTACMVKVAEEEWDFAALVHPGKWAEAARLILDGHADLLLMAYGPRTDKQERQHEEIRQAVERACGEVVYCRPVKEPKPRASLPTGDTEEMVRRMAQVGCNVDQIATVLRRPRERIKAILARLRGNSAAPLIPALMTAFLSLSDLVQ